MENIRKCIVEHGGEYHFDSRVTDIVKRPDGAFDVVVSGLPVAAGNDVPSSSDQPTSSPTRSGIYTSRKVILATGHSARDIYEMFDRKGWDLQAKGFALGVRVEHPQSLINKIQYHGKYQPYMPTAEYSFVTQVLERGVFSFCMCPGGILVPAATAEGELVLNGMSNSQRNSKWANSGVVVQIEPEDFPEYAKYGALALLRFQQDIEKKMFEYTGSLKAPAQRMMDFCRRIPSANLPKSSYHPGVENAPLMNFCQSMFPSDLNMHSRRSAIRRCMAIILMMLLFSVLSHVLHLRSVSHAILRPSSTRRSQDFIHAVREPAMQEESFLQPSTALTALLKSKRLLYVSR